MVKRFKALFTIFFILFSMAASWAAEYEWTGTQSTDWNDYRNWKKDGLAANSGEIPNTSDDVKIPETSNKPDIVGHSVINMTIKSLEIEKGATLTITLKNADITFTCTNGITISGSGDTKSATIKLYHEGLWNGDLYTFTNLTASANAEFKLKETGVAPAKKRYVNLSNIEEVKDITIHPHPGLDKTQLTLESNLEISGTFTNDGIFDANGKTVTFSGENSKIEGAQVTTFADLQIESSKKLTLGQDIKIGGAFHNDSELDPKTHKVSFTGAACEVRGYSNSTFYDFEVESGAKCEIHRDITVKNSFTNNGTFNAAGTKKTVYLEPPTGVTVTGTSTETKTKFHSIKCENAGGKTLKIKGKISVEKELVLSGTPSPVSYLTIDDNTSGEIHLKQSYTGTGRYLTINTNRVKIHPIPPVSSADWGYEVFNSRNTTPPFSPPSGTVVNGWKFMGGNPPPPFTGTLYWIGKTDTEWETPGNWAEFSGSGYTVSSHIPSYNTEVVIPQKNSINILGTTYPAQFPKLTNDFKAKSVKIEKGSNTGTNGMLDLSEYVIKAGPSKNAKISNFGTLKLTGTAAQKSWFENSDPAHKMTVGENSTVEYYGTSTDNVWSGPYQNLKVSGGKTSITTGNLAVNKSFTVDTTGGFTVNAASQSYGELVTLQKSATFNSTDGTGTGTVFNNGLQTNNHYIFFSGAGRIQTKEIYGGSEDITLNAGTGAWTSTGTIQARDITLNAGTGTWTSTGTIQARDITLNDGTGSWTSLETINARNITVGTGAATADKWTSSKVITANGNITVKRAWTATNSALVYTGNISVEGDWQSAYVGAINITARGNWTSSGSVRATGNIEVDNTGHTNTWTTAHNVDFAGNLTAAKFIQTDEILQYIGNTAKTILFRNPADSQINNIIIQNTGTLNLGSDIKIKKIFINYGQFTHNNHKVTFTGTQASIGSVNPTSITEFYDLEIAPGAVLGLNQDIKIKNSFTNQGIFKAKINEQSQAKTVTLIPPPAGSVTIESTGTADKATFGMLSLTGAGGKTLTINGNITVENLNISGTSSASKLIVQGSASSKITLTADQKPISTIPKKGYYLDVRSNIPIRDGHTYFVAASTLGTPAPANWKNAPLRWTAGGGTAAWTDPNNWDLKVAPDIDIDVVIPYIGTNPNYPVLTQNEKAQSVTVETNAELTLGNSVIKKGSVTAKLTNYGTLKLTGTADQKNWFAPHPVSVPEPDDKIILKSGSTVEYYGTSTGDVWEGPYEKLKISGARQNLNASSLTVNTDLIITRTPVVITTSGPQTYHGNVQASEGTSNYELTLTNTGSGAIKTSNSVTTGNLTVNGDWEAGDQNNSATVTVNGDLNVSGDIASVNSSITAKKVSGSGGNITVNGTRDWRCWGNITAQGDMTIHNMTATGGTIAVHGNLAAHTFHLADWGKLYFNGSGSQSLTFNDTAGSEIRELEIGSNATLNLGSPIKITYILTNMGTFAAGNHTVTLGKARPIGSSVTAPTSITITGTSTAGDTEFKHLTCTDSYIKKLTIDKKILVSGNMTLQGSGTDDNQRLTVEGSASTGSESPEIKLNAHKTGGKWLSVHTNIPITGTTGGTDPKPCTYTAEESIPIGSNSDIQAKKPDNWIFINTLYNSMTWTAGAQNSADKTKWDHPDNWSIRGTPGENTEVSIPSNTDKKYPALTAAGKAKSIIVYEKASLDLAGFVIKKDTGADDFTPITNNGTLRMIGTVENAGVKGQKEWLTGASGTDNKITHGNKSAIEYYGVSAAFVWKGPYKNLRLSSRPQLNIDNEDLVVEKKLTIRDSDTTINTGTGTQIYQGEIDAKKSAEPHWNIEFTASSVTMTKGTDTLNINAEAIKVNADTWTSSANINAASITASGSWITKKGNINLRGGLSAGSFEQENGTLTLGGSGGTLKYTSSSGKAKIKTLIITSSATVTLGSDIIITEKLQNAGTFNALTSAASPWTGYTVTLEHPTGTEPIKIIGNDDKTKTKFHTLKCIISGTASKNIRFQENVSVYGNLTLRGASDTVSLNLSGTNDIESPPGIPNPGHSGTIYINENKNPSSESAQCKWLGIAANLPIKSLDPNEDLYKCTAYQSNPTGDFEVILPLLIAGHPKNWIFTDVKKLAWTGETNTDWNNAGNWRPRPASGGPTHNQYVTIRKASGNQPTLENDSCFAKEVDIRGTAALDLADKLIYSNSTKTETAKLNTTGTLKLKGTSQQKLWFEQTNPANKMTLTQSAVVEYYDNTNGFIWGNGTDGYNTLILNNFSGQTQNTPLKVNGDLTVKGSDVTIDSGSANQTYGKNINAQDGVNLRAVTLKGSEIEVNHASSLITASEFTVDGKFIFTGPKITAAEQTYKSSVEFNNDIDLEASGSLAFEASVACTEKLILSGTGTLTVGKANGASVTIRADEQSYAGPLTLNVPVEFDTPGSLTFKKSISGQGSIIVPQNGPVYIAENIALTGPSSAFTQTGTGSVLLSAGIQTEKGITFAGPLYINNASILNAGTNKIVTGKNVFVAAHDGTTNKTVELQSPLQTDNFVLFSGNIKLSSGQNAPDIFAKGDIVLFGPAYNGDYTPPSGASETAVVSNLFTYNHTLRPAPTITLPDALPDTGNTAIQTHKGTFDLTSLAGKTLKANKNFYANGMDLCASLPWTLEIPVHDSSQSGFTEAYNTKVKNCKVVGGGIVAAAEGCSYKLSGDPANTADTNSGWDFTRPTIKRAYTVWDDVIYIEFSEPIENSRNEISAAVSRIKLNDGTTAFSGAYTDKECTTFTDGKGDLQSFYLKSSAPWNTDATGSSPGVGQSTDMGRSGIAPEHRSIKPNINIAAVVSGLYETLRDKNKNRITDYSGTNRFTAVQDNCPPVLIGVYTGQEMHRPHDGSLTGGGGQPGGQPEYDAHNFIEFRYSEPVAVYDTETAADTAEYVRADTGADSVNKRATPALGNITANGSGLKIAGFADIASGKVDAASRDGGIPHSLYRNFPATAGASPAARSHRVRLSIAGYVDRHISDPSAKVKIEGKEVHDWIGYINEAQTPSGAVTVPADSKVVRSVNACDTDGNGAKRVPAVRGPYPVHVVNTGAVNELYGSWDTSAPVFAKFSQNREDWRDTEIKEKEIVGFHSVSNIIDKFEFRFFDNVPDYSASRWWRSPSKVNAPGWFEEDNPVPNTAYDTLGGSRPASSASAPPNITSGGIRASSLAGSLGSFSFKKTENHTGNPYRFETGLDTIKQRVQSTGLFAQAPSPSPAPIDTLYLQLSVKDYSAHAFTVSENFSVAYDGAGFVTDLAGNRMKAVSFADAKTVSMVAPRIVLTIAPAGTDKMYILFNTRINTDPAMLEKIPFNLHINGTGVPAVDTSIPAVVRTETRAGTGIVVRLTEKVKGNCLSTGMVELKTDSGVMHIEQSLFGLPSSAGHKHALSDFAVNLIRPLHMYDNNPDGGLGIQNLEGGLAMRIFDGSGGPGNTVLAERTLTMGAVQEHSGNAESLKMYYDIDPLPASVSTVFNKATGLKSRVWLPKALDALSFAANSSATPLDMTLSGASSVFSNKDTAQPFKFEPDKTVEFLFGLQKKTGSGTVQDITIDHDGDSSTPEVPLYALRLKDPEDPTSIDLWYFNTAALQPQRGGVGILNNVINSAKRENTAVRVQTEKAGSLSVIVMTADGDVVRILHSGRAEKGEHIYVWDGTNKNGDPVARGMYFIRVIGPNIDETRKVMAVKE